MQKKLAILVKNEEYHKKCTFIKFFLKHQKDVMVAGK